MAKSCAVLLSAALAGSMIGSDGPELLLAPAALALLILAVLLGSNILAAAANRRESLADHNRVELR